MTFGEFWIARNGRKHGAGKLACETLDIPRAKMERRWHVEIAKLSCVERLAIAAVAYGLPPYRGEK